MMHKQCLIHNSVDALAHRLYTPIVFTMEEPTEHFLKLRRFEDDIIESIVDVSKRHTEQTGRNLEGLIQTTYRLSLEQALDEVRKMQGNLMALILWLSQGLE